MLELRLMQEKIWNRVRQWFAGYIAAEEHSVGPQGRVLRDKA